MKSFQLANESAPLSLTPKFILPEDKRPQLSEATLASIPIIDLSEDNPSPSLVVQKISQACEEHGFFQIVNHGVPENVCNKMVAAITDLFDLPPEQRGQLSSTDPAKNVKFYNYHLQVEGGEQVKMWSESFTHSWYPIDDVIHLLPEKIGTQYGEVFTEYAREIGSLVRRLLSLISIGLGLEEDCLLKILGDQPRLRAHTNFYPPCPDPEMTLGLPAHTDLNALTVLLQSGASGLQVSKDGKWIDVPPIPNAFVINLGDQIQVTADFPRRSVNRESTDWQIKCICHRHREFGLHTSEPGPIPRASIGYENAGFSNEYMKQKLCLLEEFPISHPAVRGSIEGLDWKGKCAYEIGVGVVGVGGESTETKEQVEAPTAWFVSMDE